MKKLLFLFLLLPFFGQSQIAFFGEESLTPTVGGGTDLTENLSVWYDFDDDSDSVGSADIGVTEAGTPSFSGGRLILDNGESSESGSDSIQTAGWHDADEDTSWALAFMMQSGASTWDHYMWGINGRIGMTRNANNFAGKVQNTSATGGGSISENVVHTYVVTYDSATATSEGFIDGVSYDTTVGSYNNSTGNIKFGGNSGTDYGDVEFLWCGLYREVLSQAKIDRLHDERHTLVYSDLDAAHGYEFVETFDEVGYDNAGQTESGTPDEDYATSPAPLQGPYSLSLVGGSESVKWDVSAYGSNLYVYALVNWNAIDTFENVFRIEDSTNATISQLQISSTQLRGKHGTTNGTYSGTVGTGTTYHIWYEYEKGTGSDGVCRVYLSTDGTKTLIDTVSTGTATTDPDEFILLFTGATSDVVLDYLITDTSAIPAQ